MKLLSALVFTSLFSTMAVAQSHFDILKNKYQNETNSNISAQAILGATLGRCFQAANDIPLGMILGVESVSNTQDSDSGPLFPPNTTVSYKMAFLVTGNVSVDPSGVLIIDQPASANDDKSAAEILAALSLTNVSDFTTSNGIGISKMPSANVTWEIKLGNDGLIYGHGAQTAPNVSYDEYCYFYKKMN